MDISSAKQRLFTPIDATFSSGPAEALTSEKAPSAPQEQPVQLERVAKALSPFVQAYAPHQLGSSGAPSYPRELNQPLGEDYKRACGAAAHVLLAVTHPSVATHIAVAVAGHDLTDPICGDAAPVQVADR